MSKVVTSAALALQTGRPILVRGGSGVDEGLDIVLPAALAGPHWTAWTIRHSSGFLFAPITTDRAEDLDLPLMTRHGDNARTRMHTVSVDAAEGVTTGISATDRARTARLLADPESTPSDFTRPGHLLPVMASRGGVVDNPGRAEAAVDICRLAGLPPVALVGQLVTDQGELARQVEFTDLGNWHEQPVVDISDIVTHRLFHGDGVRGRVSRNAVTSLSTDTGHLDVIGFADAITGAEHLVLRGPGTPTCPLVSVHVECTMGDIFGSLGCRCGRLLAESAERIALDGGLLVYLRRPSGVEAPTPIPHTWTRADDGAFAAVISALGFSSVRLIGGSQNSETFCAEGHLRGG